MKIIFFGNTKYSIIGAKIVNVSFPLSLFVTIPNSPIAILAKGLNTPLIETNTLDRATIDKIAKYQVDFLIVEDYGLILPKQLLKLPKIAPLNIHHSLLPKYRGSSPAPSAILAGDKISGVSIIKMNESIDAGDILAQQEYTLQKDETADSLLTKLNELGGELVVEIIKQYIQGKVNPVPQNPNKATFTKRFIRKDGYFDINKPPSPQKLDRMIRAYYPWPGVWTKWKGKIVKFLPATSHPELARLAVKRVSGSIQIDSDFRQNDNRILLQMEGKKAMPLGDFLNGYPDFPIKQILVPDD